MLRLVLPKGSLEKATLQLFADADLAVARGSDVDYRGSVDDPRIDEVMVLRPQEIPRYVASGMFDLGITGRDWVEETAAEVVTLTELHYSKATARPIRMVLAVAGDSPVTSVKELPAGVRVQTEYPELTRRFFADAGIEAEITLSYGATEAKIPEIADAVVEITETGRALRAAGLKIIDTIVVSYTERRARGARPCAREAQRRRGEPRHRDRAPARAEVADGQQALRGRRVRGRDRGREVGDQHPDPGAARRRRHRHHRAADPQDRPLSMPAGTVTTFDERRGLGTVTAAGRSYAFHATQIADGSRSIRVGQAVEFQVVPGRRGDWEATRIEKVDA
jgi:ATP phosphoribosyltransferase